MMPTKAKSTSTARRRSQGRKVTSASTWKTAIRPYHTLERALVLERDGELVLAPRLPALPWSLVTYYCLLYPAIYNKKLAPRVLLSGSAQINLSKSIRRTLVVETLRIVSLLRLPLILDAISRHVLHRACHHLLILQLPP